MKSNIIIVTIFVILCGLGIFYITSKQENTNNKQFPNNLKQTESQQIELDSNVIDEIFGKTYNLTLDMGSKIMVGNDWIGSEESCEESQELEVDGTIYLKSCNSNYLTYEQLTAYFNTIFTPNFTKTFLDNNGYKNIEEELYYIPTSRDIDTTYVGFDSYEVITNSDTKVIFLVKSSYSIDSNCEEKCEYVYKNHSFSVEKIDDNWYTSDFEMPY